MAKEYMGEESVKDLFNIISDNFVSKDEIKLMEKSLACAISVGAALIAAALVKSSETIADSQGGINNDKIATDEEFDSMLDEALGNSVNAYGRTISVISDKDFNSMLDDIGL